MSLIHLREVVAEEMFGILQKRACFVLERKDMMTILIEHILALRGIRLSEEESKVFQLQWEKIQSLKKEYDEVSSNQDDINLCYSAKGENENE
jgi:hypothetical protein